MTSLTVSKSYANLVITEAGNSTTVSLPRSNAVVLAAPAAPPRLTVQPSAASRLIDVIRNPTRIEILGRGSQGPAGPPGPPGPPGPGSIDVGAPESVTFGYTNGRITSVVGATAEKLITYNADGTIHQVIKDTLTNTITKTFAYDANKRITSITVS